MKKYTTLLFDVDDTLLDFKRAEAESIKYLLKYKNVEPTDELVQLYSQINGDLWRQFELDKVTREELQLLRFERLFLELGMSVDTLECSQIYRKKLNESAYLMEGARQLLDSLYGKYKMYIITNGLAKTQHSRLALSDLNKYFDYIFISEEIGYNKPKKGFFDKVYEIIPEKDKSKMLIIGDSLTTDVAGGNNECIDVCWFNSNKKPIPVGYQFDYIINSLGELTKLLERCV